MPVLGKGGFGKVYKYTSGFGPPLAIKEENNSLVVKCKKSHVPGKKWYKRSFGIILCEI